MLLALAGCAKTESPARWVKRDGFQIGDLSGNEEEREITRMADALARSRVVLLGESCHGAREFFLVRQRLIRGLVEQHGFRVVGLEASVADTVGLDAYARGGDGNPDSLIALLGFWTWYTTEFRELLQELRRQNVKGNRVVIAGLDAQTSFTAARFLLESLPHIDQDLARRNDRLLRLLANEERFPRMTAAEWRELTLSAHTAMVEVASALRERSRTRPSVRPLVLHATALEQFLRIRLAPRSKRDEVREATMAENVSRILDEDPRAKVIVLAHNIHISRREPDLTWQLARRGVDVSAVAMLFGSGTFNAVPAQTAGRTAAGARTVIRAFPIGSPAPSTLEAELAQESDRAFAVPTRSAAAPAYARELSFMRSIGAKFDPGTSAPVTLTNDYDYVIFVPTVTPSHLLPR
jgi:erythromycin esterase